MAEAIGVGKSTIAQAERDGGSVTLPVLLAALSAGGIELMAIDRDGEVQTMRPDALRDRRGRKLPAHLHAWVPSESEFLPEYWRGSERHNAPVRWALRSAHAVQGGWGMRAPDGQLRPLPLHHPGPEDIDIARERDADRRAFQAVLREALVAARRPPAPPRIECTCSDACIIAGAACPPECPCQCDAPAAGADRGT